MSLLTKARPATAEPFWPSILDAPPLPKPKRNACWLLREIRDRFERRVFRWIRGKTFDEGFGFCLTGAANYIANENSIDLVTRDKAHFFMKRAIAKRMGYSNIRPADVTIEGWNDRLADGVGVVCAMLKEAEALAEADGACEP